MSPYLGIKHISLVICGNPCNKFDGQKKQKMKECKGNKKKLHSMETKYTHIPHTCQGTSSYSFSTSEEKEIILKASREGKIQISYNWWRIRVVCNFSRAILEGRCQWNCVTHHLTIAILNVTLQNKVSNCLKQIMIYVTKLTHTIIVRDLALLSVNDKYYRHEQGKKAKYQGQHN